MAMTDWTIIRRSMSARRFSTVTTIVTVAVAVGLMLTLLAMRDSGRKAFDRGTGNMHALISADSSPLVSVLNCIFYADPPAQTDLVGKVQPADQHLSLRVRDPNAAGRQLPRLASPCYDELSSSTKFSPEPGI